MSILQLFGCNNIQTLDNPALILGRPMVIPNEQEWKIGQRDTLIDISNDIKIVAYYNFKGCMSCRLKQLRSWELIIREIETLKQKDSIDINLVFIFGCESNNRITSEYINKYNFNYPIMYDKNRNFEKLNKLPTDDLYHVFLLNKNNQVLLVGSPIFSPKLWGKYKNRIKEMHQEY